MNKILLERLADIREVKINKHPKNEMYNVECLVRNPSSRMLGIV